MICKTCKEDRIETEFYQAPDRNKRLTTCKHCYSVRAKTWRDKNREKQNAYKRELFQNPQHKKAHAGRTALRQLIRNIKPRYKFLLQCGLPSRDLLMAHLTSTIPQGYTLADYGSVLCVDHIKPCIMFDLTKEDEFRQCFNYTNLRLITKSENLTKGPSYAN